MIRGFSLSFLCLAGLSVSACSVFQPSPVAQPLGEASPQVNTIDDPWADVPVITSSQDDFTGVNAVPVESAEEVPVVEAEVSVPTVDVSSNEGSLPVVAVGNVGGATTPESFPEIEAPAAPAPAIEEEIPALDTETDAPNTDSEAVEVDEPTVASSTIGPVTSIEAREAIQLGNQYYARGDLRLARTAYTQALDSELSVTDEADLIKLLGAINAKVFVSTASTGDLKSYTVVRGDSLSKIARENNTTWQLLRRVNGLDSNLIRVGQEIKVPRNGMTLVVRRGKKVADLMIGGDFVKRYNIGVGKDGRTPLGEFKVINRIEKPMDKDVPFGDPRHRLGTHWLGLEGASGYEGYGIHGCRVEQYNEIGTECSEGCVRVTNEDVEEIHDLLPVGAKVIIKA